MPAELVSPADEYRRRLAAFRSRLAGLEHSHERVGLLRLALAAAGLACLWASAGLRRLSAAWLLVPAVAFIAALVLHAGLQRRRLRARAAVRLYETGLERLAGRWRGNGCDGRRFEDPHHRFAADLDLFGPGSLFELLCAARTQMGEECLARWLLEPAAPALILDRQASIADLAARLDLREDWATLDAGEPITLHFDRLVGWAQAENALKAAWLQPVALVLNVLALGTAIFWASGGAASPFLIVVLTESLLLYALKARVRSAITAIETAYEDLKRLRALLERLEAEHFTAPRLRALIQALGSPSGNAGAILARLATLVNWVESRRNPFLAPLMPVLLYPLHTALAAERWRQAHGTHVAAWLRTLGEIEALLSLSRLAYEHPEYPFPTIVEGPAVFAAVELGHPLIPAATRVCNDVTLEAPVRLLLVSGSNMSGKSTLLRAVGVNLVLAMAGAPVCARALKATPLEVGASIRINDSLHEGSSRFYAEITRLRQLLEPTPFAMLFLLDELLQGTNSADRSVGARGVALGLIRRGHIGLISTHDLALVDIPGLPPGALVNVHFQDELVHGRLYFDYRLRPGVVTKSNGVELMRSIGLEV